MDKRDPPRRSSVVLFISQDDHGHVVKTLRIHLPVLANDDVHDYLDLVTRIPGVVAALVDEDKAQLTVALSTTAVALLVREQIEDALLLGFATVKA